MSSCQLGSCRFSSCQTTNCRSVHVFILYRFMLIVVENTKQHLLCQIFFLCKISGILPNKQKQKFQILQCCLHKSNLLFAISNFSLTNGQIRLKNHLIVMEIFCYNVELTILNFLKIFVVYFWKDSITLLLTDG